MAVCLGVEDYDLASIEEKNLCKLVVDWLEQALDNNMTLGDLAENVSRYRRDCIHHLCLICI